VTSLDLLNTDFRDLLQSLCEERVAFLVVGAYAVAYHGHPRTTGDMDIWVHATPDNAGRTWRALARFGAPLQALGVTQQDFERPDMVVQIGVAPRRIDLLTGISGVRFADAWTQRVEVPWGGHQVAFLGLEDLLKNKRSTGRAKDSLDAEELERRRKAPRT
jgi:hypothetical protein